MITDEQILENIKELNLEYKNKMDALMEEYKAKVKEVTKKEEPFIKKGQRYFAINDYFNILTTKNFGCKDDEERIKTGNCYPFIDENKEKVQREVNLIAERRKLQSEMEQFARLNNEEEIDWNNNKEKWFIYIDYDDNHVGIDKTYSYRELANCTYFTSKEITQKALDKFKDRIRVLYIDTEKDN